MEVGQTAAFTQEARKGGPIMPKGDDGPKVEERCSCWKKQQVQRP